MVRSIAFSGLLVPFLAAPSAGCPTADALGDGIRVTYSAEFSSTFRRNADGDIVETENSEADRSYNYVSSNGLLETGYYEIPTGEETRENAATYTYDFDVAAMLPLVPWSTRSGTQIELTSDGSEANRIPFKYSVRGVDTIQIGPCAYTRVSVDTFYFGDDPMRHVEFGYLPDLGISLLHGFWSMDGDGDRYTPQSIELATEAAAAVSKSGKSLINK